ncbi:MAG TPA: 2-oxo-4-hydroxy-4-carboxy-5-ureidoimidazoline decarboxylase [Chloroflexia bacterium]|nr:2-oxo-4-hydroxy-4-carboxy-5-ureidoimidazoline decarboxylase [Chloroflexia bacterium]
MRDNSLTLSEINNLGREEFTAALGSIFEGPPWIAAEAWHARPFRSVEEMHAAMCAVMYGAPQEQQVALIAAHPDLVGKAALAGTLTPESTREQAAAGLDHLTPAQVTELNRLNAAYREKYGFPFVVCARENKLGTILSGFDTRLNNTRDEEIRTALDEIAKIAWLRLNDLV